MRLYYTGLEVKLGPVFGPLASALAVLPGSRHAELMTLALKHAVVERDVAHLIQLGGPNKGAPKAYPYWEGLYLYRLTTDRGVERRKMLLLR